MLRAAQGVQQQQLRVQSVYAQSDSVAQALGDIHER
jgi:hypothetical protein